MPKKLWVFLRELIEILGHGTEDEKVGLVDVGVPFILTCGSVVCDAALVDLARAMRYALCQAYEEGRTDAAREAARGKPSIAQVDKWMGLEQGDRSD